MNFDKTHITTTASTSFTNVDKIVTSTSAATISVGHSSVYSDREDTSNNTLRTEANNQTENIVNPSHTFTTPQNCLQILTSIQSNQALGDCGSVQNSSYASFQTSTLLSPTFTSSNATVDTSKTFAGIQFINKESSSIYMDGNEENVCYFERKKNLQEELAKENYFLISNSYSNVESSIKSTLLSITNCASSASGIFDRLETEAALNQSTVQNICCSSVDNIELPDKPILACDKDSLNQFSENSEVFLRSIPSTDCVDKIQVVSRLSKRAKKKSWYNVLYPNYKSRSLDFRRLFKEVPSDERLIVDYSCALYKDLLIQGRLYISQNYVCFHANIFGWETCLIIKWKDVTSITKEKTALVIPNAISICTPNEKFFFSSFTTRDKTFLILFRVWQNTLMNKLMSAQEIWQLVHNYYGDELGLTTDDDDYIDPTVEDKDDSSSNFEFVSATDDLSPLSACEGGLKISNTKIFKTLESGNAFYNSSDNYSATSGDYINSHTMKANAKEFSLSSRKLEDETFFNSKVQQISSGSAGSGSGSAITACHVSALKGSKLNMPLCDSTRKVSKMNRQREENTINNSETLPTDVSNSSDSEEISIPFVATTECDSPHEGRQLVHTILPINIETLFNLLFSKSKFLLDFHKMRKSTDLVFSNWVTNEDGRKTRTFNVTVQLAASVGPKTSKVTEFQVMRDCSKTGELYSIDINNVNAGIPYADSFSVLVHYCLVKTVDDHTMLSVHAQIKYKKSIWGVVKGFIEKNTWAGLDDFYTSLLHSLQSETCIPPAKGKGKRPRRGAAAQTRPLEEIPILQTKPEPSEICGIAQTVSTHHSTDRTVKVAETTTKFRWLSLFVIVLLFFLITVNIVLLIKLWKLEERIEEDMSSRARIPNLLALKQLPYTHEGWIELLQQQVLHETELKRWHTVLKAAIKLLKKTEKTLADLMFR